MPRRPWLKDCTLVIASLSGEDAQPALYMIEVPSVLMRFGRVTSSYARERSIGYSPSFNSACKGLAIEAQLSKNSVHIKRSPKDSTLEQRKETVARNPQGEQTFR